MAVSLRFYCDGIGLAVLADKVLPVDLAPLLGVPTRAVRTVFLGEPGQTDSGIVVLLDLGEPESVAGAAQAGLPARGVFLLSVQVDVDAVLSRLNDLGLGGQPRTMPTPGGYAATVVDPDGVMVELLPHGELAVMK